MKNSVLTSASISLVVALWLSGCGGKAIEAETVKESSPKVVVEEAMATGIDGASYAASDRMAVMAMPSVPHALLKRQMASKQMKSNTHFPDGSLVQPAQTFNQERYANEEENGFKTVINSPLSTLGIDVDTASYSNITRMIQDEDRMPPEGAVRIEELINYFSYDYPQPDAKAKDPFTITTEVAQAPWNKEHQLMLVGLQAKKIAKADLPASNFVVLVDVSGSMEEELPLVKQSLKLLARGLDARDRISIVNYADNIGITLEPTKGSDYTNIEKAIDSLRSYGGTDGASGIDAAYTLAKKDFIEGGNNRILMMTDGDFNVGRTSESEMVKVVEKEREHGVYLSIVGFGYGNLNDQTMEQMADKGNGNYNYVNDLLDAKKVFASEMTGTLYTLGKDVKFQVEFNPNVVGAYRLVGYENRRLNAEDFNDDSKDAGEIGVGHSVTALYELVPAGAEDNTPRKVDALEYQQINKGSDASHIATVKMRYKEPDGESSQLMSQKVQAKVNHSDNLIFASSVAAFGMKLKNSQYLGKMSYSDIISLAKSSKGKDDEGYRAGLIRLVEKSELISK